MSLSAKVLRWASGLFAINAFVVLLVSGLASTGDDQQLAETTDITEPKVEVPDSPNDPPSLPAANVQTLGSGPSLNSKATVSTEPHTSGNLPVAPPVTDAPSLQSPASNMVLDEILRTIRSGDGELNMAPLEYPPLVDPKLGPESAHGTASHATQAKSAASLKALGKRMGSLKQLTIAADALMVEAQVLAGEGLTTESQVLLGHVSALRNMIAQLAVTSPPEPKGQESNSSRASR